MTNYVWDVENDSYLTETDENHVTTATYTNEPVYYGKLVSQRREGDPFWYHFDGSGSTREVTNTLEASTNSYSYGSWGEIISSSGPANPFLWGAENGYYYDQNSGGVYIRAREYSPTVARWSSPDPLGIGVGEANLYIYGQNTPTNTSDPSGMWADYSIEELLGRKNSSILHKLTYDEYRKKRGNKFSLGVTVAGTEVDLKLAPVERKGLSVRLPGETCCVSCFDFRIVQPKKIPIWKLET